MASVCSRVRSASIREARHRAAAPASAILFAITAGAGCFGAGPPGAGEPAWTVRVDTLPDGRVRVVNQPPAGDIEPTWVIEPELVLGSMDDAGPASFGQVKGIVATPDGRIAVLDAQAQEVRVFGDDGAYLRTIARRGSGPGELRDANGMVMDADGLIRVNDPANNRLSIFDPDRGFVRSHTLQYSSWGFIWDGVMDSAGRVWETQLRTGADGRAVVWRAIDPDGRTADSIRYSPGDGERGVYRWERGAMLVPFWPSVASAARPPETFWVKPSHVNEYRLLRYHPEGDTIMEVHARRPAVPVSAAERDSAIAAVRRTTGGVEMDWSLIPSERPTVQGMFLDADGRVWVRVTVPDGTTTYDVFGPDGRYAGTAVTPLNIPAWWRPDVRGDLVHTLHVGEFDVPYVVRARTVPVQESRPRG